MYVVMHSNNYYFHNKGKIILFESHQEVQYFLEVFSQYATHRMMAEGNPIGAMQASATIQSKCKIIPDFDTSKITCDTIMAREILEKQTYN